MLTEIDLTKHPIKPKLYLCKPNKQSIAILSESYNIQHNTKFSSVNELSFTIPVNLELNHQFQKNPHIDMIKDRYLIKLIKDQVIEYYMIDKIIDASDDSSDTKQVSCFSLQYELADKLIRSYEVTSYNALQVLTDALSQTLWSIDYIDPIFLSTYRSFNVSSKTVLSFVVEIAETFSALITYNTILRTISLYNPDNIGINKDLRFSYGNLIKTIEQTINMDNFATRLKIYGENNLTIASRNPTGTDWLENMSNFMNLDYMSQGLINAIVAYEAKIVANTDSYSTLLSQLTVQQELLTTKLNEMDALDIQLTIILDSLDIAQSTSQPTATLIAQRDVKQLEIDAKQLEIDAVNAQIVIINGQITALQNTLSIENNFTPEQIQERNIYIIEKEATNSNYTNAQDLYEYGLKEFEKICKPEISIKLDLINFLEVLEMQHMWDKLVLGDFCTVYYPPLNISIKARIINIDFDYENGSITLTIANVEQILTDEQKFLNNLYNTISTSTSVNMDKYKYDGAYSTSTEIEQIINNTWDAVTRNIKAGVNESVTIGRGGIIITSPDNNLDMVRLNHSNIAVSSDGGNTFKNAITKNGVIAENVVGILGMFCEIRADQIILGASGETIPDNIISSSANWNSSQQNAIDSAKIYADNTFVDKITHTADYTELKGLIDGSVSTWFYGYAPIFATVVISTIVTDIVIQLDNVLGLVDGMSISFIPKANGLDVDGVSLTTKIIATGGVDTVNKTITLTTTIGIELTANQVIIYNAPASDWNTTALRDNHLGDVFYDNLTGYGYRFVFISNLYSWSLITDSAITEALQKANDAYDLADHKRTIFISTETHPTPTPPYQEGDLWDNGSTLKICTRVLGRTVGESYSSVDWSLTSVGQSLEDISSDNKLTAIEKKTVKLQWDAIVAEKSILDNQATTYGILLQDVYTIYHGKYNDLDAYLNTSIIPPNTTALLFSLTATSDIVGNDFRTCFSNYYTAKKNLLNLMNTTIPTVGTVGIPVANADGTITISWSGFTDNGSGIAGYYIWRATSAIGANKLIIGTATQNVTSFIDKTTAHNTTYYYFVSAHNKAGNESSLPESEWKSCTANNTNVPSAPTNLVAVARLGRIDITWDKSSSNDVVGYILEKSIDSGLTYPTIFNVNTNSYTEYNISVLGSSMGSYKYKVKAVDIIGLESLYVSTSTSPNVAIYRPADNVAPNTPTNLTLTPDYDGRITISWTASSSTDVEKYRLYRSLNNSNYYVIAETTSLQYTDSYLKPAQTYYYKISSIDYSGMESSLTSAQNSIAVDNTAPTPPNPTTTSQFGAIKVTWTEISEQGLIYEIWRCSGSTWSDGTATKIASVAGSGASQGYFIDYDPPVDIPTTYTYKLKVRDKWNNVSTSFSLNSSSATSSILNDTVGLLSTNPNFSNWFASSNYPVGFSAWSSYSGPTRETTLKINGSYACRWNIGTAQAGMAMDSSAYVSNIANHKYLVIEIDFMLVSGALTGAGILINWIGMSTPYHATIKLSDYVLSPTLGKWYTVRTLVTRPHDNLNGWTGMTGYVMANSYSINATIATKDIIFDRVSIRIATSEEINTNEFVNIIYPNDKTTLEGLIDGKIESYFTSTDPNTWIESDRTKHNGDMWYNTLTKLLKRYNGTTNTWELIEDQKAIDAYNDASTAQDTADGKRTVFVNILPDHPSTIYKSGDLWDDGICLRICKQNSATEPFVYNENDWDYTSVQQQVNDIASDSKLTQSEKQAILKEWNIIVSEKAIFDTQATAYGISASTEKTNYNDAYVALDNYLNSPIGSALLTSLITTSEIVGTTFRANFKDYYDKKTLLSNKLSDVIKTTADNSIQSGLNYNKCFIDQNGVQVKNATETEVVKMGEFDTTNHLYGLRATHSDGSGYTQLSQNGLERLVSGETIPYQYETYIISATTVGISNSAWISTSDPQYAIDVALWDEGITLSLPPRFHGKNFQCFLTMKSLEIPIANEGGTVRMVFKTPVLNIDKINGTVNVVGYAFDNAYGLYMYQGIDFNLIVTL